MSAELDHLLENHSFYFTATEGFVVEAVSPAFKKISGKLVEGVAAEQALSMIHPPVELTAKTVEMLSGQLVTFRLLDREEVGFSGTFKRLPSGEFLFLGFPQLTSLHQFSELGLSLADFVPNDPIRFYIGTLQVKESALADSLKLTERLAEQNQHLEQRVEEQTRDIRKREEDLRQLISQAAVGIVVSDADGVLFANQSCCDILGKPSQDALVGRSIFEFFSDGDLEQVKELFRRAEAGNPAASQCEVRLTPGDSAAWVEVQVQRIAWENREALLAWIADITVRKQHEQRQAELLREVNFQKYALDQHAIVSITDADGRITYVNDKFAATSGYAAEELIGRTHRMMKSGLHTPDFYRNMWTTIRAGKVWHGEVCNRTRDGSDFWVDATIVPFLNEQGISERYISIHTDITRRKHNEVELLEAKNVAERATQSKSDFLANVSHEIRTPMNAIIGMTHLALQTDLNKQQQNYIIKVHRSAESLLGIINDILDFSKIEAGRLEFEQINFELSDVVDNMVNLIGYRAEEKGIGVSISIESDVPHKLTGDPLRISQVLINLGTNAVKFSEKGDHVSLKVSLLEVTDSDALLRFDIQDTGIGMSQELQDRLFESFTQADTSTTRKYGGTGLGLFISRQIVRGLGGDIWVQSEEGVGSTFHFTIRFARQQADDEQAEPVHVDQAGVDQALEKLRGARVLLVEDNDINMELANELLTAEGIEVGCAFDGQQAIGMLASEPFDAVLMDLQMPVLDGLEATRCLRAQEAFKDLPIIAMTANVMKSDQEKVMAVGMNDYIAKPIDPDLMLITLAKWIRPKH